jgi:hypothetical protein
VRRAWTLYATIAALVFTLAAGATAALAAFAPERLEAAWRAVLDPSTPAGPSVDVEREQFRARVAEYEESRARREEELRRLEVVARASLARSEAERVRAETLKRETEALAATLREPSGARETFETQVDLLARLEPATALAVLKPWPDAQVGRALRTMRVTAAAAITDAMRGDTSWTERLGRIFVPPP